MTRPAPGEWWCPGRWRGQVDGKDTYSGCDGDPSCETCKGRPLDTALEGRISKLSWWEREGRTYRGRMLRGWANLIASRYGRPVYLVGGALEDAAPRDIDVRVALSTSDFEARFGDSKNWNYSVTNLDAMDEQRRWHLEIAKMNVQAAGHTHLPVDFQIQPLREAAGYMSKRRVRIDDVPELRAPWED